MKMDIQALIDAIGLASRRTRTDYHLTLGSAIEALEKLDPTLAVVFDTGGVAGPSNPHSYRGYYADLSFESDPGVTVGAFLADCRKALDEEFTGYKGGEFKMAADTPLWNAPYGCTGRAIIAMNVGERVVLVTKDLA